MYLNRHQSPVTTNLLKRLISTALFSITACTPVQDENHDAGFITVSDIFWAADHDKPYPFTTNGEISCGVHPEFGPAVYFEPAGFNDESSIGTPLNKAAAEILKQVGLIPNVPYSIKKGADLSEAIDVGLKVCSIEQ